MNTSISQLLPLLVPFVIVNIASMTLFGVDKRRSISGGWRIPDLSLLLIAFLGPFGAYAGMLLFRHKTRKVKFLLVPMFLILQLILIEYFKLM